MSKSNNIDEYGNYQFEVNADEFKSMSPIFEYTKNTAYWLINSEVNKLLAEQELMSDDEFLDLIPINGFFH